MRPSDLKRFPAFHNLSADVLQAILERARSSRYPDQAILCAEGQAVDGVFILLEGTVEIIKALGSREEHLLAVRQAGDTLGEMNLFAAQQVRTASVRAVGEVHTLWIPLAEMEALVGRFPQIAFGFLHEISARMRASEDQLITHLRQRNRLLQQALQDLQAAQAQIVAQEKLEHELAMARHIQESLLPKEIPSPDGWRIEAMWQPARAVSGDFYDFIPFPPDRLGVVIGDVTGKGVPAALVMAISRSVLHGVTGAVAETQSSLPGELLSRVNQILCPDMPALMFVTCLLLIVNLGDGSFQFANAGHVLPYQITPQGVEALRAVGMPLGILPEQTYDTRSGQLRAGEGLLFLSDGMIEAHNPQGEMYGLPRLTAQLQPFRSAVSMAGEGLIACLRQDLRQFTGPDWEQEDDLTLMTLRRD